MIDLDRSWARNSFYVTSEERPMAESGKHFINSFISSGIFLYPLKTSETLLSSDVFKGVYKYTIGKKWIKVMPADSNVNSWFEWFLRFSDSLSVQSLATKKLYLFFIVSSYKNNPERVLGKSYFENFAKIYRKAPGMEIFLW